MKKSLVALVIVTALAAGVAAQVSPPVSIYAGGLMSFPNAPDNFKSNYKNGFHGMLGLGMKAMPFMQFVGKAEYHRFAYDLSSFSSLSKGAQSVWMFGGDLRIAMNVPSLPIKPYIIGGGGLARVSFTPFEGTNLSLATALNDALPANQTKAYYNIGGGLEFKFAPMVNFFLQVRYVSIATDDNATSFVPLTLGLKIF
jgi:opacity protein-like surface antigen